MPREEEERTRDEAVGRATKRRRLQRDAAKPVKSQHSVHIAQYHTNEKRIAQLTGNPVALFKLRKAQDQLDSYQDASERGATVGGGATSRWLVKQLRKIRVSDEIRQSGRKFRLLDVGALSGSAYVEHDWIHATSIDINPRGDGVQQADFFAYPTPLPDDDGFDLVSLSLVLNFVGNIEDRGEMLRLTVDHLTPDGMLYLVLPLACVTNSRYIDHARLTSILAAVGYDVLTQHDSAKLTYWLCKRSATAPRTKRWQKKILESRQTGSRNNFAIVLR